MRWRQNPQRVAWIVLIANFIACCALAVFVPLSVRSFVLHSTTSLAAVVTTTAGTVQLRVPGANEPNAVSESRAVPEGSQVVTDKLAQALVTVSTHNSDPQTVASIRLFQDTALGMERVRTPRFGWSSDANSASLVLQRGRIRIATVVDKGRPLAVDLRTPDAVVTFATGTFDVVLRDQETQVTALTGEVQVTAAGSEVLAEGGQRVVVAAGRAPNLPVPAEQNLVRNGNFDEELAPAWQEVTIIAPTFTPGEIARETNGRQAVHFARRAEDGAPNTVGLTQDLEQDVQGHDDLVLQFDLQLLHQSVPGGGQQDSEYPIKVDIFYTDIYGKDLHWFQGFYYLDLPLGSTWMQPTGQKIPLGVWYTYESPNLFDVLKDTRPAKIHSITISASGHDYDSLVSGVGLIVR